MGLMSVGDGTTLNAITGMGKAPSNNQLYNTEQSFTLEENIALGVILMSQGAYLEGNPVMTSVSATSTNESTEFKVLFAVGSKDNYGKRAGGMGAVAFRNAKKGDTITIKINQPGEMNSAGLIKIK